MGECLLKQYWPTGPGPNGVANRVCRACAMGRSDMCRATSPANSTTFLKNFSRSYLMHLFYAPAEEADSRLAVLSRPPFAWWMREEAEKKVTEQDQWEFNKSLQVWHNDITWCTLLFLYETDLIGFEAAEEDKGKWQEVISDMIELYFEALQGAEEA